MTNQIDTVKRIELYAAFHSFHNTFVRNSWAPVNQSNKASTTNPGFSVRFRLEILITAQNSMVIQVSSSLTSNDVRKLDRKTAVSLIPIEWVTPRNESGPDLVGGIRLGLTRHLPCLPVELDIYS